jgi:hypothetical protein
MLTINLNKFRFLNRNKIDNLNHFAAVNKSLMPHAVAVAVGCSLEEATTILLYLYGKDLVDGYILVYHISHLDNYFEKRRISEGFSVRKDFVCPVCELQHDSQDELFYDMEFRLKTEVEFTIEL